MPLYFFTNVQPTFPDIFEDARGTVHLTEQERLELVRQHGQGLLGNIPLCIDHAGGDSEEAAGEDHSNRGGFFVPNHLQIGRSVFFFVNNDKVLSMVGEINHEQKDIENKLADDMINGRQMWGSSLGTNVALHPERSEVVAKFVSHVGLTTNPEHGKAEKGASWFHFAALNPDAFYSQLNEQFLSKDPAMLENLHPLARERLLALIPATPVGRKLNPTDFVPTQAQEEEEEEEQVVPARAQSGEPSHLTPAEVRSPQPQHSSTPPPPQSVPASPVTSTPAMATPTQAPPVVAEQQQQQQQQPPAVTSSPANPSGLKQLHESYMNFFRQTIKNENGKDERVYTAPLFNQALDYQRRYNEELTKVTGDKVPGEVLRDMLTLNDYVEDTRKMLADEVEKTYPAVSEESRGMNAVLREAINDPLNPSLKDRNVPLVQAVFAGRSDRVHNETVFNTKFQAQRALEQQLQAQVKELQETTEKLKRDRDTFESEKIALAKSLEEATKRARLDSIPTSATTTSALQQPPVVQSVFGATPAGLPASATTASVGATAVSGYQSLPPGMRFVGEKRIAPLSEKEMKPSDKRAFDHWVKISQERIKDYLPH